LAPLFFLTLSHFILLVPPHLLYKKPPPSSNSPQFGLSFFFQCGARTGMSRCFGCCFEVIFSTLDGNDFFLPCGYIRGIFHWRMGIFNSTSFSSPDSRFLGFLSFLLGFHTNLLFVLSPQVRFFLLLTFPLPSLIPHCQELCPFFCLFIVGKFFPFSQYVPALTFFLVLIGFPFGLVVFCSYPDFSPHPKTSFPFLRLLNCIRRFCQLTPSPTKSFSFLPPPKNA